MREVCLVPTFQRPELLFQCLSRIRKADPKIEIHLFPDHGTWKDALAYGDTFKATVHRVPAHNYYGNSYNTMEAYRWAYEAGFDLTYLIEDDVFVHRDFFSWHRNMHEDFPDIFAAMAWIFNRAAPIDDGEMFQPWYYSIGTSFSRAKLELIAEHATPLYYGDMGGYIRDRFSSSPLNDPFNVMHTEQDGLIQRILDKDKSQTVSPGIAKCSHMGFGGYNRGWNSYERFFEGCASFPDRVRRLDALFEDPYWRISLFGREIVEREVGKPLPMRQLHYRIRLPGGWESEFTSEMNREHLPSRINSVPVPADAQFALET